MSRVNAEFWDDVQDLALNECLHRAIIMQEAADGMGDHALSREQRITRFEDYAATGVLDALEGIGRSDLVDDLTREYAKDLAASPLVAPMGGM